MFIAFTRYIIVLMWKSNKNAKTSIDFINNRIEYFTYLIYLYNLKIVLKKWQKLNTFIRNLISSHSCNDLKHKDAYTWRLSAKKVGQPTCLEWANLQTFDILTINLKFFSLVEYVWNCVRIMKGDVKYNKLVNCSFTIR